MRARASALDRLVRFLQDHRRHAQHAAGEGGQLAGEPDHREAIGAIGGHLDVENGVVEAEVADEIGPRRRLPIDDEETGVVLIADAQLALGAEHPLGFHAADPRRANAPPSGQHGARGGERRAQADRRVGSAADHPVPVAAGGDAAQDEAVTMALAQLPLDGLDLADHDAGQPRGGERRDARHLDAGVDQPIGRVLRAQGQVHELADPAVRDFHVAKALRAAWAAGGLFSAGVAALGRLLTKTGSGSAGHSRRRGGCRPRRT